MKKYGHLYEKVFEMENLELAHKNASRGKGWYQEVIEINKNPRHWLRKLQHMLIYNTYKTSKYTVFTRKDGLKTRIIYKLSYFPDRICQWALMQVIEPILVKLFIRDTYSAIPGRGIHLALERIKNSIKSDIEGTKYCLKMDVKKFYPSINHNILKDKFKRIFKDEELLWLIFEIIDSTPENEGIPIGNYLSQWCGNFYLSDFDHWIKETEFTFQGKPIRIKYYYRYMDDMIILSDNKEFLHWLEKKIYDYLQDNLKLTLKSTWQVFPIKDRGIDFIGYRIFPDFTLLRKYNVKNFKSAMGRIERKIETGQELTYHDYCSFNSYLGWLKPCDSYRLKEKYMKPLQSYIDQYYHNHLENKGDKEGLE